MDSTPRYTHDCECCKFLGTHGDLDLYWCSQGGLVPTLLGRFGNDGNSYLSSLQYSRAPYALVAKQLAAEAGLDVSPNV